MRLFEELENIFRMTFLLPPAIQIVSQDYPTAVHFHSAV